MLFNALAQATQAKLSLFFTPVPEQALHQLPYFTGAINPETITFVGPNIFLTPQGWTGLAQLETEDLELPIVYEIDEDPSTGRDHSYGADCFSWSRTSVISWLFGRPLYFDGIPEIDTFPISQARVITGGAMRSRRHVSTPLARAMNRTLTDLHYASA
ncbi:hypothetical protein GCM10025795_13260 [Verticiella sediminum]